MSKDYLDEFFGEIRVRRTGEIRKPSRRFGPKAAAFIMQRVAQSFPKYKTIWAKAGLTDMTVEDCANQFYTDRVASMAKEMDSPGMTDDLAFEKYVSKCIVYWFLSQHERTDEALWIGRDYCIFKLRTFLQPK